MMADLFDAAPPAHASLDEATIRRHLAAAYRLSGLFGWTDMVFNHISARLPARDGAPDTYLINPEGWLSEEITPGCLLEVDVEGTVVDQPDQTFIPAGFVSSLPTKFVRDVDWTLALAAGAFALGFVIHSAIHTARPSAACIMHNHSMAGMVVSALREPLQTNTQISMEFYDRVAYHDFGGIELDRSASDRIVDDLGDAHAMIMRNHGLLTVGASVPEAFYYMHYLHQSCEIHLATAAVTDTPLEPSAATKEHTARQYEPFHEKDVAMIWAAMLRKLDREMPGWDAGSN